MSRLDVNNRCAPSKVLRLAQSLRRLFFNTVFSLAHSGLLLTACIGILLSVASSYALTLEDALTRVASSSPGLAALERQLAAAEARVSGAMALPDPRLQFTYFGESVETRTGPQQSIYSLSQTVPWPQKLITRKAYAQSAVAVARLRYMAGLSQQRRDLRQHYIELAYLEKALQSMHANLDLVENSYSIVDARVRTGASLNALLRLELEKERVADQLERMRQQYFEEKVALAALLAIELTELEHVFTFPPGEASWSKVSLSVERLYRHNPELQLMRQRMRSFNEQLTLSRLERYPDFTLGLNYIDVGNKGNAPDAGQDPWAVTVAVTLPIWEGKNRSAIRESTAYKSAYEQQYREREWHLKAEFSAQLARRADHQQRTQRYAKTLIPLAEQALENSRGAYQSNQVGVLELIDSKRSLLDLNLNYWRSLAHVLQSEAAIRALLGDIN